MAILLLVVVLLAPLTSIARDLESAVMKKACACQMLQDDCAHDNEQPDDCPCNNSGDCCDYEDTCHDSMEPHHGNVMKLSIAQKKLFQPNSAGSIPEVYLPIFVPPES